MDAADIIRQGLQSPQVRQKVGEAGTRVLDLSRSEEKNDGNGIIQFLWNAVKGLAGWLIQNALKLIQFSATAIWGLFVSTANFVWNFNWNMSDDQLDKTIQAAWVSVSGILGGTIGNAIGYLACGVLPAATVFVFNQPLGAYLLKQVGEEAVEELVSNLGVLCKATLQSTVQTLFIQNFKNARKFIKSQSPLIKRIFGDKTSKIVDAWGAKGSKPWSFASAMEETVESIPNVHLRNAIEELLEEAWEGCVEAGYVIANSLDNWIAQRALAEQLETDKNPQRIVEVIPDRSNKKERIVLAGPEQELKSAVTSTLAAYQLLENRDVGTLVGMPMDDYLRAKPQSIRLIVKFYSIDNPPWYASSSAKLVEATYAIPDVRRAKCDWETIKLACGGANGYMWGRFRCTANLSNGRQMQVMGASGAEAEQRLRALAELSEATILGKPSITEDRRENLQGQFLKQPTRVYPAFFTIMNQYRVVGAQGSGATELLNGPHKRKHDRINLWPATKPLGTDERIREMLLRPGADQA